MSSGERRSARLHAQPSLDLPVAKETVNYELPPPLPRKRTNSTLPPSAPITKKRTSRNHLVMSSKKSAKSKVLSESVLPVDSVAMDTDEGGTLKSSASIPIAGAGKKSERGAASPRKESLPEEEEEKGLDLFGGHDEDAESEEEPQGGLFGEDEPVEAETANLAAHTRRLADLVMNNEAPRQFNPLGGGGGRWKEYQNGLTSEDEMVQLDALINLADELCVMTEETANGFKLDNFIPSLVTMLNAIDNPNMVLLSCRCMSHILEALPGSENAFIRHDAVPGLVEKLLNIEYDDLRDQAMNVLSRLCANPISASNVLKNGGLCAILANLDFSAINTQVTAVNCAANMLRQIPSDCWPQIRDALPTLSMLLQYEDPRLVDRSTMSLASICTHYIGDASKLEEVVSSGALQNLIRLITERIERNAETTNLTWMVIRCLATLCRGLPNTTETLVSTGIPSILKNMLLLERENATKGIRQSAKTNTQAVYDMVALADQLLPPLPTEIAVYLKSTPSPMMPSFGGGRRGGLYASSSNSNSANASMNEIDLMSSGSIPIPSDTSAPDARTLLYQRQPNTLLQVSEALLGTMTLIFGSRVNPQLRAKCLSTIAKIIHSCSPAMLATLLKDLTFSSFVASLLASKDLKFIAVALCIAEILMTKLPDIFSSYFTREGVVHEVEQLIASGAHFNASNLARNNSTPTTPSQAAPSSVSGTPGEPSLLPLTPTSTSFMWEALASPPNPSVMKARFGSKDTASAKSASPSAATPISFGSSPPKSPIMSLSTPATPATPAATTPTKEGEPTSSSSDIPPPPNTTEVLRQDVVEKCTQFKKKYFALDGTTSEGLDQLSGLANELQSILWSEKSPEKLKAILENLANVFLNGISTHEFVHSALPTAIFQLLTIPDTEAPINRLERLQMFVHIFGKGSKPSNGDQKTTTMTSPLLQLVKELHNAIDKNENFQVKLNPAMNNGGVRANAIVEFLTKAFSVRLVKDPSEKSLPSIPEGPVSVEPLATGKAIQDFIWNKLNSEIAQEAKRQAEAAKKAAAEEAAKIEKEKKKAEMKLEKEKRKREFAAAAATEKPVASRTRSARNDAPSSPSSSSSATDAAAAASSFAMDVDEPSPKKGRKKEDKKTPSKESKEKKSAPSPTASSSQTITPVASSSSLEASSSSSASEAAPALSLSASSSSSLVVAPPVPVQANYEEEDIGEGDDELDAIDDDGGMDHEQGVYVQDVDPNAVPDVEPLPSSSSTPSLSTSQLSPLNLLLTLNGAPLTESSSFFKVIKEKATENALASNPNDMQTEIAVPIAPLWSQTHTIHYRMADAATIDAINAAEKQKKDKRVNTPLSLLRSDAAGASLERVMESLLSGNVGNTCGFDKTLVQLLGLLKVLFTLNREIHKLVPLAAAEHIFAVPTSEFINAKLTAKLSRQLQDPLALCTNTLPPWCASLSTDMSFLFPLDLRQLYFRGSSLGVPRALIALKDRVEGVLDGNFGRISPHKVRVERDSIRHLNSAFVILQRLRNDPRSVLEVEYANEVATGAGPTLEFYTLVSHAFQQAHLGMWVPDGANRVVKHANGASGVVSATDKSSGSSSESSASTSTSSSSSNAMQVDPPISSATASVDPVQHKATGEQGKPDVDSMILVNNNGGLFPSPVLGKSAADEEMIRRFSFLGTFLAKAIMDDRMVDFPLSTPFLKALLGVPLYLDDLQQVYPYLVDILKQFLMILDAKHAIEADMAITSEDERKRQIEAIKFRGRPIEDMWLTFDLPGTNVELVPGGADKAVTIHNLEEWVNLVVDAIAGEGVRAQFDALRSGFASIFDVSRLAVFAADELETLVCGNVEQDWSRSAILEAANYTHGFSVNSRVSGWFATVLSEFNEAQRRKFLRFATGSPRLPPRGFKGFHHRLTLSRKDADKNHKSDDYYPSVSTCFLFIKIPDYSTFEIFKDRFMTAIENGQSGFGLS